MIDIENWWDGYFDEIYYELYREFDLKPEKLEAEINFIEKSLELKPEDRILDLACGYGRHAIGLAKKGYNVCGLDFSNYLLSIARNRAKEEKVRVTFLKGDMRHLEFHEEFDKVYNYFTSFGYFSDEDNFEVMKGVSRALKRGGLFLLETLNILRIFKNFQYRNFILGGDLVCLETTNFDPLTQRISTKRDIYKGSEKIAERNHSIRLYTPAELEFLFKMSGMRVRNFYGSAGFEPYSENSARLIVVAEKF